MSNSDISRSQNMLEKDNILDSKLQNCSLTKRILLKFAKDFCQVYLNLAKSCSGSRAMEKQIKNLVDKDQELQYLFFNYPEEKLIEVLSEDKIVVTIETGRILITISTKISKVKKIGKGKNNLGESENKIEIESTETQGKYQVINHVDRFHAKLDLMLSQMKDILKTKKEKNCADLKLSYHTKMDKIKDLQFQNSVWGRRDIADVRSRLRDYTQLLELSESEAFIKKRNKEYYLDSKIKDFEKYNGELEAIDFNVKKNSQVVQDQLFL